MPQGVFSRWVLTTFKLSKITWTYYHYHDLCVICNHITFSHVETKPGKFTYIFFSHQHAWYPLLDMDISLLRIWCILFDSILLSLFIPRIRDSSIFWKLTITKLNRSYSFLATLPLELVIIYRYIYINNPKSIQIPYRLLYPHDHIPWYSHDISIPYEWFLGPSATGFFFHSSFCTKQSPLFAFGETPAFRWCLFKRYMVRSHHWITAQLVEITWNNTSNFNMEAPTNSAWKMILWFSGWMWHFFDEYLGEFIHWTRHTKGGTAQQLLEIGLLDFTGMISSDLSITWIYYNYHLVI